MSTNPDQTSDVVTRFAPSPSGHLHLGHAYSALFAWQLAERTGGSFHLRIEDIDSGRSNAGFEEAIYEDLQWLGLTWPEPVMRQSDRSDVYAAALDKLRERGLLYPCFCTRKEILAEIEQSASAPHSHGPDGPLYPGICRALSADERAKRIADGDPYALRLDAAEAATEAGPLTWFDRTRGEQSVDAARFGDVVLARKDIATSYHLAVTIDDAAQGVSVVTRGDDLFEATHIHRLLQALLGLDVPEWHHTPMLTDPSGKRLAKRDNDLTLRTLRETGVAPENIWTMAIQNLARAATAVEGL